MNINYQAQIEQKLVGAVRQHLDGLRAKVENDFSKESFDKELGALRGDPVYPSFAFDIPEYVLIRLVGRISISIGRRLGEIYDKIPRFVAAGRFQLQPNQVAPDFEGLELDLAIRLSLLGPVDQDHVRQVVLQYQSLLLPEESGGVGIEIRYNFNPNDSARLRKDVDMAHHLLQANLLPIYLVFSSISPRDEAIARLSRAGWKFLVGIQARDFARDLFGLDLESVLQLPSVKAEIKREVDSIMRSMLTSFVFRQVLAEYSE